MTRRMDRVNVLLRQEISLVLTSQLKDPRLSSFVSVTRVDSSSDMKHARVFVSVFGDDAAKKGTLTALKSAARFVHRAVRQQLAIKNVPALSFHLDESIEQGAEMLERIKNLTSNDLNEQV